MASWLGIAVQYGLTLVLACYWHYLIANTLAIVLASTLNFWSNDRWTFRHRQRPSRLPTHATHQPNKRKTLWITCLGGIALMASLGLYLWDLGGDFIPRNGDEMVYAHIAFKTAQQEAQGGGWLPLVSDLPHMRNTKPPLVFWQAMAWPQLGFPWTLLTLRLPSYLYTLLTTLGLVWATRRWAIQQFQQRLLKTDQATWPAPLSATGLAYGTGVCFLTFFSTYRYGRPYLTSAPETFWFCLPALAWLSGWVRSFFSWRNGCLMGLSLIGLALYKSFILVAPVALAWALWGCLCQPKRQKAVWGFMTGLGLIAWGVFGLWFLNDPHPQAIWQEFVLGENWGKLHAGAESGDWLHAGSLYLQTALWGGSSIWVQALAIAQNAAVIGPLTWIVCFLGLWRRYRLPIGSAPSLSIDMLWALLIGVMSLFFMLPSQRSARYLIPLMPLVAFWFMLNVWMLPRWVYRLAWALSLLLALGMGLVLASFVQATVLIGGWGNDALISWLIFATALVGLWAYLALRIGHVRFNLRQTPQHIVLSLIGVLGLWLGLSLALIPLHRADQHLSPALAAQLKGAALIVPSHFNGDFERYRFLLPTAGSITPDTPETPETSVKLAHHTGLIPLIHVIEKSPHEARPACELPLCQIVHQRWVLRGRHQSKEISWQTLIQQPETIWFAREYWLRYEPTN
jgi:hypothetical protein